MSELLDLVLKAHGGLERWHDVSTLNVKLSMSGGLYAIKGFPEPLSNMTMRIDAHQPAVMTTPYAGTNQCGYFTPDRVWIADQSGQIMDERLNPRESFAGHVLQTKWDQLQRLYFTSYALWNYLTTPFLFTEPNFEIRESEPHRENGETWWRLHVKFPPHIPTHCPEQIFFFNQQGLLQRLDYVTDVAGGVASHYCFDHRTFGGLVFPTLRRVVPRKPSGPVISSPTAVLIQIADIAIA